MRLALLLTLALLPALSPSQVIVGPTNPLPSLVGGRWSGEFVYDLQTRETSACIGSDLFSFTIPVKGLTVKAKALGGFAFQKSAVTGGMSLGLDYAPSTFWSVGAGFAQLYAPTGQPGFGLYAGLSVKL